jgi:hypothetical protein
VQLFQDLTPAPVATPIATTPVATPVTTPVTAPVTPPPATAVSSQQIGFAAILALVIYLGFFGVLGYRRGAQREAWVLAISLGLFFILQRFSSVFVELADKFGKGWAFLLGQPIPTTSPLGAWAAANTSTYLISIWLIAVLFAYFLTGRFIHKSKKNGWAVLAGIANGLVFATVFAPLLTSLIYPGSTIEAPVTRISIVGFLQNIWQQTMDLIARLWVVIQPNASSVFFLSVIVLVLFAAFTLRTSVKAK